MKMSNLPKTVPTEFASDFKRFSFSLTEEDEGLVQCCQYPSRRENKKDRSTIIEFVHIPLDKQENLIKNDKRRRSQGISRNGQLNRIDRNTSPSQSRQQPTRLYHQELGTQYIGISQPSNVVHTHHVPPPVSELSGNYSSSSDTSGSTSTTNSVGFKYKTHLYQRYSSQIEEENRIREQLFREP